jgi:transcriptional regulator with XRE-family HTH domain
MVALSQEYSGGSMVKLFLLRLKAEGWTQEAIAAKIGARQNVISKLMKGGDCKGSTIKKLADAFGVSTDTVLEYEPAKERKGNNNQHGEPKSKAERPKAGVA